ncbi:MAG: hypothetical protein ACRD6N_16440, partial [Pyrinomonadaceae bacterium]
MVHRASDQNLKVQGATLTMLHRRSFLFCLLTLTAILFSVLWPSHTRSTSLLRRITNSPEVELSLNPTISGDGQHLVFESTLDLAGTGGSHRFRALRGHLSAEPPAFDQIAFTRAVAPAISQDGSRIAFASTEDLVGRNADHNSEIFLYDGSTLGQLTNTTASDITKRLLDGNLQPSISDDGRVVAFSSNRNLVGLNADLNSEIFLFDVNTNRFTQLTSSQTDGATNARISGDGSHVAYLRDEGKPPVNGRDLILYNRITDSTITITGNAAALALTYGRAISDDGLRVVYSAETAENQSQVFLFDAMFNSIRQITALGTRADDVPLNPTISGDGKRIAFATRRSVIGGNSDRSVELYLYDIPTAKFWKLTDAPTGATAEVVSSLNDDGSIVVFNFPRVLSGPVSAGEFANNSEIYVVGVAARPLFGEIQVMNGASFGREPATSRAVAPNSIAVVRGEALASAALQAKPLSDGSFPHSLAGTIVTVNGRETQVLYVSPDQINFVVPPETEAGLA